MISNLGNINTTNFYGAQPAKAKASAGVCASYTNSPVARPSFTSYNPVNVIKTTLTAQSDVKKYTEITELTPEILNELIEKIIIHQTKKINGKKVQEIDIYYRGVGIISFPVSFDNMKMAIEKMLNERITA